MTINLTSFTYVTITHTSQAYNPNKGYRFFRMKNEPYNEKTYQL